MNGYDIAQNMETQGDGVPLSSENPTGKNFQVKSSTKFDKGYKQAQQKPAPSTGARPQEEAAVVEQQQQQVQNPYQPSNQAFSNSPYFQSNNRLNAVPSYNDYVNARRQASSQQQFVAQQQQMMPQQRGQLVPVDLTEDQQMLLEIKESEVEWALKKAVIPEIDKKYDDLFQQEVKKIKGVQYDKITGNAETKDMQARQQYNALVEEFAQRKQQEIDAKTQEAEQRLSVIEQRVATGQLTNGHGESIESPQVQQRQIVSAPGTKTVTFSNGKTVTFHAKPKSVQAIHSEVRTQQRPSLGWGSAVQHKPSVSFGFGNGNGKTVRRPVSLSFNNMMNAHPSQKKVQNKVRIAQKVMPFTTQPTINNAQKKQKFKLSFNWGKRR